MIYRHDYVYQYRLSKCGLNTYTVHDNFRRDRDEILLENGRSSASEICLSPKKVKWEKKEKKTRGEFETLSKVKKQKNIQIINTILINANDVRIIMIIVVILTIGNSPILY